MCHILVFLISTFSGRRKKAKNPLGRRGASGRHLTKLEQSRFSLDIYDTNAGKQLL
jgi:hypothetical protein